jgi:plasmid stabilization system protein ParE
MKLTYLDSTKPDLAWLRTYYGSIFPEGAAKAAARYLKTIDILQRSPYIGRPIGQDGLRKLSIPGTPFSIFYQIVEDRIEIVRVWDQRSDPAKLDLHEEATAFA